MRTRLLLVLLLSMALLAGCTNKGDDGAPGDNNTPGSGGTGGTGGPGAGTADVQDFNLTDSGAIQGPFTKQWDVEVANVGFTNAMVHFALTGAQAGAPPTARVNLVLLDPEGGVVKSAVAGLGGSGDTIEWTFTAADLSTAGTYTLQATAGDQAPLPSVGIANYDLMVMVEY